MLSKHKARSLNPILYIIILYSIYPVSVVASQSCFYNILSAILIDIVCDRQFIFFSHNKFKV